MSGDLVHLHKSAIVSAAGGQSAVAQEMGAGTEVLDSNPILDNDGDRFLVPVYKNEAGTAPAPTPIGSAALSKSELFVLSMILSRVSSQLRSKKLQLNPQEQKSFDRINPASRNWGANFLRFLMLMNNKPSLFGRFARKNDLPMVQAMQRRLRIAAPRHLNHTRKPGYYSVLVLNGEAAKRLQKTADVFPDADPRLSVDMDARRRMTTQRSPKNRPVVGRYSILNRTQGDAPKPSFLNARLKQDIAEAQRPTYTARPASKPSELAYTG